MEHCKFRYFVQFDYFINKYDITINYSELHNFYKPEIKRLSFNADISLPFCYCCE